MEAKFDEHGLGAEKSFLKQCDPNERLILCFKIEKINERNRKQERKVVEKTIIPESIKRRVDLTKIQGITVSTKSPEFVVHIQADVDLRYHSAEKKELIIDILNKTFIAITTKRGLPQFFKNEMVLEKYTTQKTDVRKGIDRTPVEKPAFYDEKSNDGTLEGSPELKRKPPALYSKIKSLKIGLGDFVSVKELSKGAFGKILLVQKRDSGELFAMKTIKKIDLQPKKEPLVNIESLIAQHVNHPFFLELEYSFQDEERLFFVTKYMKGGDLFVHLAKERRFSEERAKFYAASVVLALEHLHSSDLVYRDLKPENILVDENGYIYLTDFGMARLMPDNTDVDNFTGTPEYIAPEILLGENWSKQVDWWCLGILVYEMLIGLPPFYHSNKNAMFQLILESTVKFPTQIEISEEAKSLVDQLLEKNPKKRLGFQNGPEDIKIHPWFFDIKWEELSIKTIQIPFKPKLMNDLELASITEEERRESKTTIIFLVAQDLFYSPIDFNSFVSQLGTEGS